MFVHVYVTGLSLVSTLSSHDTKYACVFLKKENEWMSEWKREI